MTSSDERTLYLEDLEIGRRTTSGPFAVSADEIKAFGERRDDRPWHVDEVAAERSIFGGLVASGAHVIAIFTRLSLDAQRKDGAAATLAGLGVEIRLEKPVRPGDRLDYRGEVVEKRESKSRPDAGIVRTRHELVNQDGEVAFVATSSSLVGRRPSGG